MMMLKGAAWGPDKLGNNELCEFRVDQSSDNTINKTTGNLVTHSWTLKRQYKHFLIETHKFR